MTTAQRIYDRSEPPADTRSHAQIEQDVAERIAHKAQADKIKDYVHDPKLWGNVEALRLKPTAECPNHDDLSEREISGAGTEPAQYEKLIAAVRRALADEFTQLKSGHRTALEQLTQ